MGFWHTGYFEHHEEAGLGDNWQPARQVFHCQHCDGQFVTIEALRQHRFEAHPYVRPIMFVRGIELGASQFHVTRKIRALDFQFSDCEEARIDGVKVPVEQLAKRLSKIANNRARVELMNSGVTASYDLNFRIAEELHLDGVDRAFVRLANRAVLSIAAIDGFISECRRYKTAEMYLDGIAKYLYGVLAKERSCDSSLAYEAYPDQFNAAIAALSDFDRPLARAIRGLVAFQFNHFHDATINAPVGRLQAAAQRFLDSLNGDGWHMPAGLALSADAPEELLTDSQTDKLLSWSEASAGQLMRDIEEIAALSKRESLAFNQLKAKILLSAAYEAAGDSKNALKTARELRADPDAAGMASRIIDRLTAGETT